MTGSVLRAVLRHDARLMRERISLDRQRRAERDALIRYARYLEDRLSGTIEYDGWEVSGERNDTRAEHGVAALLEDA